MTEKQLLKLNGHRVFIEMHTFPHSVDEVTYIGELIATPGKHSVIRDGTIKTYDHCDFYIDDEKTDKLILIEWNQVKLITFCDDLGVIRNGK